MISGSYSRGQLQRNRRAVRNLATVLLLAVLAWALIAGWALGQTLASLAGITLLAGLLWWLFASDGAGPVEGVSAIRSVGFG